MDQLASSSSSFEACREGSGATSRSYSFEELRIRSLAYAWAIYGLLPNDESVESKRPLAVCVSRGFEWYALYLAAVRLRVAVAPMTQDITDAAALESRNGDILRSLHPLLVITDEVTPPSVFEACEKLGCRQIGIGDLLKSCPSGKSNCPPRIRDVARVPMAYVYTGGTTRASKCVQVSHGMAMHELDGYPRIVGLRVGKERMLQHSSTYWGATFLGQINIALAFGASVVFAKNQTDLTCIIEEEQVTVLGLVPSQLHALSGACKSVRTIFTWGEKLPKSIAAKWTSRATLVELLVSTEYWLCLYALNGESEFRILDSAQIRLDPFPGGSELCIGGNCVSSFGYTNARLNAGVFEGGWFRSSDLVEMTSGGRIRFLGRSDQLIKIGGEWRDLFAIQEEVRAVPGVGDVAVLSLMGGGAGAFVEFDEKKFTQESLTAVRRLVNENYVRVVVVRELPRHAVTGKVDRAQLQQMGGAGVRVSFSIGKKKKIKTLLVWTSILLVTLLPLLLLRGCITLVTVPILSLIVLHEPRIAKQLSRVPAAAAVIPACVGLLSFWWLALGLVTWATYRFGVRYVCTWTVSFWLGFPRQIEREQWWRVAENKKIFSENHPGDFHGRVGKIWEPFGRKSFSESQRLAASLATFEHQRVEVEESEVGQLKRVVKGQLERAVKMEKVGGTGETGGEVREVREVGEGVEGVKGSSGDWSLLSACPITPVILSLLSNTCEFLPHPINLGTCLAGVNSLAAVEIASHLRELTGRTIAVSDVLGAVDVRALVALVVSAPRIVISEVPPQTSYKCQLWGWGFPCTWVFELDPATPVDFCSMKKALQILYARHPAFRVKQADPTPLSYWMNETLVVVGLLKNIFRRLPLITSFLGACLFECWNRVVLVQDSFYLHWRSTRFSSEAALRTHLLFKKRKCNFYAPVEVELLSLGEGRRNFLRLFLTHAFSDGSSVIPILKELNELYAAALAGRDHSLAAAPPSALLVQETRLRHSLTSVTPREDDFYLCYNMDMSTVAPAAFGRIAILDESFVALAQKAAKNLACPIDVLFLSAVACALARIWGWTDLIPLALIVPLRDGPHEAEVVGFLADQRNLDIQIPPTHFCSLLSVVNAVHTVRRKRAWQIPEPFSNCERTLVNIVQASYPANALFKQELLLQQHEHAETQLYRPMELYIEQVEPCMWSLKARCRRAEYDEEKFGQFLIEFKNVVFQFIQNPHQPLQI